MMKLLLLLADGEFHSGDDLGASLGVTRAAVWKQIQRLQEDKGLDIYSVKGKGYRLSSPMDLLDASKIKDGLSDPVNRLVGDVQVFGSVTSTNDIAMKHAEAQGDPGYVCVAEQQTAGRGRRGRPWVSPYGTNIYLSMVWDFFNGAAALEGLSLAVGVAIANALKAKGVEGVELKWPNDVLVGGAKLGGILLEMTGDPSGHCHVVLGVGINISISEKDGAVIDQAWVDTTTLGACVARNEFISEIICELVSVLTLFSEHGFAYFRDQWLALDAFKGKAVVVKMGKNDLTGIASGVDSTGALRLDRAGTIEAIKGGEVSLRLDS
ncbi:biotin--[acetyl-CoA-carboxylase] ligase [Gammaproteobacteria bacterium 42_54_T18]|nr:biotin--[acetyl-CoA-carboxylase] ligase [Gammaproteobacteria bacterium 42_54_T18]